MNKDIFKIIKEQLNPKDVVEDILGKPDSSGKDNKYHSPFYEGDNDPSFIVSDEYISDFSANSDFGKGKDIFNFIVSYNDVSHFISDKTITELEALKWLVAKYNLNVEISGYTEKNYNLPRPYVETKVEYSLERYEHEPIEIWTMFDTEKFNKKPSSEEMGQIKNRIDKLQFRPYSYSDMLEAFENGQTCIPSGIKSEKDWKDNICKQQIFLVDIDNTEVVDGIKKKYYVGDVKHITVDKILEIGVKHKCVPTCIYKTFSYSDDQHRFRLVYVLDRPIETKEEIKSFYKLLISIYKDYNVDTAPTSVASMFLGGTEIAHNSNFFYTLKKTEKQITNFNALDEYNKILKYSPYAIHNKKLCSKKLLTTTKNKDVCSNKKISNSDSTDNAYIEQDEKSEASYSYTEISNFITYVDKKITYNNGNDTNTYYQVNCVILDNPFITLKPQLVDADKYSKGNYILGSPWDKYAIIRSGRGNPDKIREVTQIFSKKTMEEETVYAHTGFRRINDKLCYLYHGGVIGNVQNINVDLSKDNLQHYCFTNIKAKTKEDEFKEAVKAIQLSYSILDVADYSITVPLLSTIYLAPITSILKEEDILMDYILFIQGKSGTRKSSLSAVGLSHFGKFNRDTFPCSFRDTTNSIEKKAYILKDTINVIDDYNPEIFGNAKLATIEKLFGMYGDRSGRTRMMSNGSDLKNAYTARGIAIITGETFPEVHQSRVARSIITNIEPSSINLSKLSYIQENIEQLSYAMRKFIELIIYNEEIFRTTIKSKFKEFMSSTSLSVHGRTNEISSILKLGFYLFAEFLLTYKIIDETKLNNLTSNAYDTIDELVKQQSKQIEELDPSTMFFNAFEELLSTQAIYVDRIENRHQQVTFPPNNPRSELVGYYDIIKDCYYLFPQKIYCLMVKFYKDSNQTFPLNEKNLWKYLNEKGYLYRTDKSRYTVQRMIYGMQRTVIEIKLPKIKNEKCVF